MTDRELLELAARMLRDVPLSRDYDPLSVAISLVSLGARLPDLELDAARMDYMDRIKPITFCPYSTGDDWYLYPDAGRCDEIAFRGPTLRDAIDAALSKRKEAS